MYQKIEKTGEEWANTQLTNTVRKEQDNPEKIGKNNKVYDRDLQRKL